MKLPKLFISIVYLCPLDIYCLPSNPFMINKLRYRYQESSSYEAQNTATCNENRPQVWCLPPNYRKEIKPWELRYLNTSSLPWNYHLYFDIIDIHEINEMEQTIKFGMYFSVAWHEPRLQVNKSADEWILKNELSISTLNSNFFWYE